MNKAQLLKRVSIAGILAACTMATTVRLWAEGTSGPAPAAPTASEVTATAPAGEQPIAVVNGHEINNKKFNALLMQVAGLRVFQEVLDLVLVQQACTQAGIPLEGEEFRKHVQEELDRTLEGLGAQGIPEKDRGAVLAKLLQEKGVTEVEFQMGLQRAAGLRQLAKGRIDKPTDKEIQEAFVAQYGEKVQIEVLTVKSIEDAAKVRQAIVEKGEEPRAVAQARQIPWQALTISSNNADPKPIADFKKLAFTELKEKQLSAAIPFTAPQGDVWYLVYLDKKIPKQDVLLPAVQKKVEEAVQNMKETNWMNQQLNQLRTMANVKINDPILSNQFAAIEAAMQRQRAATQPGGANATQPGANPLAPPPAAPATTMPKK